MRKAAHDWTGVSTEDQATNGVSLDAQVAGCLDYASANGYQVYETVVDAGFSAKSTDRAGLQKVLSLVNRKKIQHLVILKLDRLSRRTIDALNIMENLSKKEVKLHLVQENGSVNSENTDDEFILTMKAGLAQLERRKISDRTKFALNMKRQLKQRISFHPPYGYQFVDGTVIENSDEQRIIKKIRNLHTRGVGIRTIIKKLNRQGFDNRHNKPFAVASVHRIINRPS